MGRRKQEHDLGATQRPDAHARIIAWTAIGLTVIGIAIGQWERYGDRQTTERTRQAQAFTLGRRVSVYESNAYLPDPIEPNSRLSPESLTKAHKEWNALMAGNDMAIAATPLSINLSAREDVWILDQSVAGQIHDLYSRRVEAAFELGRLLGRYDGRSYIVASRSSRTILFKIARELADSTSHLRWRLSVDSLAHDAHVDAPAWSDESSVWDWCCDGRGALETIGRNLGDMSRGLHSDRPAVKRRDDWRFQYVVTWERGAWAAGSAARDRRGVFDKWSCYYFENMIGNHGWDWRPD